MVRETGHFIVNIGLDFTFYFYFVILSFLFRGCSAYQSHTALFEINTVEAPEAVVMGKSRRAKANGHRADPMAIKAVKPPTDPELIALREKSILPVIKDLRSSDPKARGTAASAVANIVQDERCRKLLLREQIVQIILTETLTDASLDSRAAGWEILRVIASEEESDFCVHLFRLEILAAIEHAVKNVSAPRSLSLLSLLIASNKVTRSRRESRNQASLRHPRHSSR